MSNLWIFVHDRQQGRKVIKEIPTTAATLSSDRSRIEKEYPFPRYSLSSGGSTEATATGTHLLGGWDTDGFREHDQRVKAAGAKGAAAR